MDMVEKVARAIHQSQIDEGEKYPPFDDLIECTLCMAHARAAIEAMSVKPDCSKCPKCGGPADNGNDRCVPPTPYYCSKCEQQASPSRDDTGS